MFYLGKCSKSFMEYVCLLLFVGGIYTCQPGQHLFIVNCMSTCSMDFRQRSINMANFNCGFFFSLFSSIRFCFVHFEALWRLLCFFPSIYCFSSGYIPCSEVYIFYINIASPDLLNIYILYFSILWHLIFQQL